MNERLRSAVLASDLNEYGFSEMVLHTDPVFAEAALNPNILALAEFTVGAGFLVHSVFGSVKPQGGLGLDLHADQQQFPEPYPEHPQLVTACWSTEDYSAWADELIGKYGPLMSQLLGRDDHLFGSTGLDIARSVENFEKVKR